MKRPEYFQNVRPEMLPFIPGGATKILEVGCGCGAFGAQLRDRAEVWGIEPTQTAEQARTVLDRVLRSTIEDADLPSQYFDCVIFNDVLEHLVDPGAVLRKTRDWLKSEGVVVTSIPNVGHFSNLVNLVVRQKWEYTDEGIMDSTHLRFFTRSSIQRMFMDCGYEILRLEGVNDSVNWKFHVLNLLALRRLNDARYFQFGCVARKSRLSAGVDSTLAHDAPTVAVPR